MYQVLIVLIMATCTVEEMQEKTRRQEICAEYLKKCDKHKKCSCRDLNYE